MSKTLKYDDINYNKRGSLIEYIACIDIGIGTVYIDSSLLNRLKFHQIHQ
jgi:hypothetical protein